MPETEVRHNESWFLTITPGEGETWPDTLIPHLNRGQAIRPDKIIVALHRGVREPRVSVQGHRLKQDGTPGELRSTITWARIEWVTEIVEHQRRFTNLGPGVTGVDW